MAFSSATIVTMPSQHQYADNNFDARSHFSDSAATNNALFTLGSLNRVAPNTTDDKYNRTHSSNFGTLRGSHFKSNQSLCSCNAETEVRLLLLDI